LGFCLNSTPSAASFGNLRKTDLVVFLIQNTQKKMTIEEAGKIMTKLEASSLKSFVDKLIATGIRYSRLRVDWWMLKPHARMELDQERTIAHNAFISSCDILARNMTENNEDENRRRQKRNR